MAFRWKAVCLVVLAVLSPCCWARDFTFTFRIGAGRSECFYDYIHEGAFLEIEYQVSIAIFRSFLRVAKL